MILLQVVQNTTYLSNQDFWLYLLIAIIGSLFTLLIQYPINRYQNSKRKKKEIHNNTLVYIEILKIKVPQLRNFKMLFREEPKKEEVERILNKLNELRIDFTAAFGIKYLNCFDKISSIIALFLLESNENTTNILTVSDEEFLSNQFNKFSDEIKSAYK